MNHVNFHSSKGGGQLNKHKDHGIYLNTIPMLLDRILDVIVYYINEQCHDYILQMSCGCGDDSGRHVDSTGSLTAGDTWNIHVSLQPQVSQTIDYYISRFSNRIGKFY